MFQRTKICSGLLLAFGSWLLTVAPGAFAQDTTVQRVEITGSSIKRVDAETSVPVTVIKADELKKAGVTSVEQVLPAGQLDAGPADLVASRRRRHRWRLPTPTCAAWAPTRPSCC